MRMVGFGTFVVDATEARRRSLCHPRIGRQLHGSARWPDVGRRPGHQARAGFLIPQPLMKRYLRLVQFLKPHLGVLSLALLCMLLATIFGGVSLGMIIPLADKVFTDHRITISDRLPLFLHGAVDWVNDAPRTRRSRATDS